MGRGLTFIIILAAAALAGFVAYRIFFMPRVELPRGETSREMLELPGNGVQHGIVESKADVGEKKESSMVEREIFVTNDVKHSVPLNELISGGPGKDGIPSIDKPDFTSPMEASGWLADDEPGVAFSRGNVRRFYPYQILVWHEIVNDTVAGERILVTYCPLCLTGSVFDPLVGGERVEFGVSGLLWKSNLVMYDRKTDSLWPQVLGEAVVGEMTGSKLKLLESDQMRFGEWKKNYPKGEVLSRNTGSARSAFYGSNPYSGYFVPEGFALRIAGHKDSRLPSEAFVFGIVIGGKAKAYSVESVKEKGEVADKFEGQDLLLRHDKDLDVVRMFIKNTDGSLERINPFSAFWFSWAAAHPQTELYK